jgi:PAS domain S-box-containing protein
MPFVLLSNHGHALVAIAENPDVLLREIAQRLGITERATQSIVNDLVDAGYVQRTRVGRRNRYTVDADKPFPHPALRQSPVRWLLWGLVPWKEEDDQPLEQAIDLARAMPLGEQAPPLEQDDGLDRLTGLVASLLHAPVSFDSLVSDESEMIVSGSGVPEELLRRELPLELSICQHVVSSRSPLVVSDAAADPLLRDNLAVTKYGLRSYAGLPLLAGDGSAIGSLCVADTRPRDWTQSDVRMLTSLAAAATSQVEVGRVSRRHQQAAEQYRMLLDSVPEALILVLDRELRIQVASGGVVARSGRSQEQLVGRLLEDVIEPDRQEELRRHYQAGLDGTRHQFTTSPDQTHWFSIDVVPLRDGDGEVTGVMSVGREHLVFGRGDQWDADRLRALIENVPAAIYRCAADREWTVEFISDHIEAITGYPAAEFVEGSVRDYPSLIHPEDRPEGRRAIEEALAERRRFSIEYRIVARDGSTRWVRERGQGIRDENGTLLNVDGTIVEIDEHTRLPVPPRLAA